MKMSSISSISSKEFGRRYRKALSVPFILNQMCSTAIDQFVKSYATSLGCSEKCVFFPLLTCCAACMGMNGHLELTTDWKEPPILWTIVITPKILYRIDTAEHIKQQLLQVQNELLDNYENADNGNDCNKQFIIDMFSLNDLQEILQNSGGHGIGLYSSVRMLQNVVHSPLDIEVMQKLHSGSSWFSCLSDKKKLLFKTCVNFSIISKPSITHDMIQRSPNFCELFRECFLISCAEEKHIKFQQLSPAPTSILRRLFRGLIELHCKSNIVYTLNSEARTKFSQIHDELTDKAKQMSRKNSNKIFHCALSYLGRLCCVLHVLDNVLEAINWNYTLDSITWNTEITASTVWNARQVLSYVIEQKYALEEEVNVTTTPQKQQIISPLIAASGVANLFNSTSVSSVTSNTSKNRNVRNFHSTPVVQSSADHLFDSLLASDPMTTTISTNHSENVVTNGEPTIVSVRSAGLPVRSDEATVHSDSISQQPPSSNSNLASDLNLPSSMSVSVVPELTVIDGNSDSISCNAPLSDISRMTDNQFIKLYKTSIRRLFIHNISDFTPLRCVQMKLTPDPSTAKLRDPKLRKYTSSFAQCFLQRLTALGFGVCNRSVSGSSRHFLFKKKPFKELGRKQKQFLVELRVNEREYDKCFASAKDVVLLE